MDNLRFKDLIELLVIYSEVKNWILKWIFEIFVVADLTFCFIASLPFWQVGRDDELPASGAVSWEFNFFCRPAFQVPSFPSPLF